MPDWSHRKHAVIILVGILLCPVTWGHAAEIDDIYAMADQKRFQEAMTKLDAYLQKNPKDPQGRFLKGLIQTEQKHPDEAITTFKSLSADYPNLPEPYNNLAVLYAEKGQYEEAAESLKKAIKTLPTYGTAQENLGDIYAKMASQAYSKALSQDSQNRTAQTKLDVIRKLFTQQGSNNSGENNSPKETAPPTPSKRHAPAPQSPATTTQTEPAPAKTADQTTPSIKNDVEASILQWAKDWSEKNSRGYLSAYSSQFRLPSSFSSRDAWETRRNQVINQAGSIRVTISKIKVTVIDPTHAQAVFKQDYRAANHKDSVQKTLAMVLEDGRWKIMDERSGNE